MILRFGYRDETYGTIEATPDGLKYDGDEAKLRRLVAIVRHDDDEPPGALQPPAPTPEDFPGGPVAFLRWMARQTNNGYLWNEVAGPEDTEGAD
jgi:hypothetical protein